MGIITLEMQPRLISSFCILLMAFFGTTQSACTESKCGDDHALAIHFPFRRGGHEAAVLNEQGQGVVLIKFFVNRIDYKNQEIQLHDPLNCLLVKPLEIPNMSNSPFYFPEVETTHNYNITLFHCPDERDIYLQVPCLSGRDNKTYAVRSYNSIGSDLQSCTKMYDVLSVPLPYRNGDGILHHLRLKWSKPNCTECEAEGNKCRLRNNGAKSVIQCLHLKKPSVTKKLVATCTTLGSLILSLLVVAVYRVYSSDRKEKENRLKIERFLEDYKALKPSRYSYADLKRITNNFKDKLGEGAYGTVFKGKLSSEFFVAVKLLNNSKGNGEEFINEVGTMGHIYHVNVVRMVGFCADGYRRALVYEFLPNGSLQDFISSADDENCFLGWDKLQDIALGIAKGIEYLHQGCNQRILHFDIKPHNVLLDQNFIPKISDFGLAKLCSKDQSIVSMTTARGTLGYIAPEVFSRNFGNVSYKSDVYSFGMLLLEMVGGRKNIGPTTEATNEVYYPEWIYSLLEEREDLRIHIGREEGDGKISKKLAIVGLWCIQWNPVNRPSMKVVVQMLEGGKNDLTMPPNPFASTRTTASVPTRRLNLELEAIAEVE